MSFELKMIKSVQNTPWEFYDLAATATPTTWLRFRKHG
jgi:hypothetical protein